MRHITVNQQRVLDRIYTYAVETGDWPGAQALRLELYKAYKLKLEDIEREIDDLVVCNDVSVETTTCLIRLPALQYIDSAKKDRPLIGKLVAWLVQCYLNSKSKGLTREQAAEALEADQKTTDC